MALEGEFSRDLTIICDCGTELDTEILRSNAGHYLGHFCPNCGPYDRQTEYMTKELAENMLSLWYETEDPIFTRSTEFNYE